jgi:hypothetical protein
MNNSKYRARRAETLNDFAMTKLMVGKREIVFSPDKLFQLQIDFYGIKSDGYGYRSTFSRGIVTRTNGSEIIADVVRNYPGFWNAWVSSADDRPFLLCGEDYQGYSVVDLISGETNTYFPDEAYDGHGFCWVDAHPSPDGLLVAVEGCYWGGPYEIVVYSLSELSPLPLREIVRIDGFEKFCGWVTEGSFSYEMEQEFSGEVRTWSTGKN